MNIIILLKKKPMFSTKDVICISGCMCVSICVKGKDVMSLLLASVEQHEEGWSPLKLLDFQENRIWFNIDFWNSDKLTPRVASWKEFSNGQNCFQFKCLESSDMIATSSPGNIVLILISVSLSFSNIICVTKSDTREIEFERNYNGSSNIQDNPILIKILIYLLIINIRML